MGLHKVEVDLHLHTNYSDGTLTPKELLTLCKNKGLKVISITDHDITMGLSEANEIASDMGIELIEGIELGALWESSEIQSMENLIGISIKSANVSPTGSKLNSSTFSPFGRPR